MNTTQVAKPETADLVALGTNGIKALSSSQVAALSLRSGGHDVRASRHPQQRQGWLA